jgi:hypothetical protein
MREACVANALLRPAEREKGSSAGRQLQLTQYFFQHRVDSLQHIVVPETDHSKAVPAEQGTAARIVIQLLQVLPTIEFDYQAGFQANEIDNKPVQRMLPTKFEPHQSTPTQMLPKRALGVGASGSQESRFDGVCGVSHFLLSV